MLAAPIAKHIDLAILRSREALAVAEEIEAAPARLASLQAELAHLASEVTAARNTLSSEKAAWQSEWQRLRDERARKADDLALEEQAHLAKLAEAKATLAATQNKIGALRLKLEKIAALFRKHDLMIANPSAGAPAMPALVAEILEATR